ncbi:MAG: DUF2680 domain-containing protein [Bacillota bacterium]
MTKKIIAAVVLAALGIMLAVPAFADTASDAKARFDSWFAAKKAYVDQAVSDGRITAEQGETLKNHFDQMYQLHEQNGFTCPMGGPGLGRGQGVGMGQGNGQGLGLGKGQGPGQGRGMGRGIGGWYNNQTQTQQQ